MVKSKFLRGRNLRTKCDIVMVFKIELRFGEVSKRVEMWGVGAIFGVY